MVAKLAPISAFVALALLAPAAGQAEDAFGPAEMAAGGAHSCAIRGDASIVCWGDDSLGQLDGVPAGSFVAVSAGRAHSCAIRADQTLACWGDDSAGQLDGVPGGRFAAVSAGGDGSCGIRVGGALACWGGGPTDLSEEVREGDYDAVSVGGAHACAVRANTHVACWGSNADGQVSPAPGEWPAWHWRWNGNGNGFVAVSAGGAHSCGLRADGAAECWGDDTDGQLEGVPEGALEAISAGASHSCGLLSGSGALSCWGDDSHGQLDGIPAGAFATVSAGGDHSCAAPAAGRLSCWGQNDLGQSLPFAVGAAPPAGTVGVPYSHRFRTTPQVPGPVYSVVSGALPAGLRLSGDGELSGVPQTAGESSFVVAAANGATEDARQEVTLLISAAEAGPPPPPPVLAARPAELPPPVAGESFNLDPVGGVIKAKCPGTDFKRLERPVQVSLRCLVDAREGTVDVTASRGSSGQTQTASFWGGLFGLAQEHGDEKKAEMSLVGKLECERRKLSKNGRIMLRRRGAGRRLWGSGKGNYQTSGNHGSATVRGTTWLVADRCDGSTLFKVREGTVWVDDFATGRQVVLDAGESYIAKSPIPRLR